MPKNIKIANFCFINQIKNIKTDNTSQISKIVVKTWINFYNVQCIFIKSFIILAIS